MREETRTKEVMQTKNVSKDEIATNTFTHTEESSNFILKHFRPFLFGFVAFLLLATQPPALKFFIFGGKLLRKIDDENFLRRISR
jgi:hypothetical protein